jgi:hypothetical protein
MLLALMLSSMLIGAGHFGDADRQASPKPTLTIDGRTHPEMIPAELAWETAFSTAWQAACAPGDAPTLDGVNGLSKYTLHITPDDVHIFLRIAKDTLDRARVLREPFDREHATGVSLGWTQEMRIERQIQIGEAIIDGRDELVRALSPQAFRAVKRWVSRSIVPGTKLDYFGKH